ncbi:MAG: uroporphyrinogen decarboxylase family protein [Candidatus Zipacnadales bacterium]
MSERERFLQTMTFGKPDRVPNYELGIWGQTYERWASEGAPPEALEGNWFEGLDYYGMDRREFVPVNLGMIPLFEPETLEETERYIVFRDAQGIVHRALKEGTVRGTRPSMDQYLRFAVETPDDFHKLKQRYDPADPRRYPLDWETLVERLRGHDHTVCLCVNCSMGLYSNCRVWMGTENLSLAFYDQPSLVHEMMEFIAEFTMQTLERALMEIEIDYFNYFEDFAYKTGPLLSPEIFRKFLLPRYQRINDFLRRHGVNIITLDSDGNTEVLIPLFIEAGINGHWPLEIAAGMDPVKLRRQYGQDMAFMGGIDKRALARGKQAIEEEVLSKVPLLLEQGGYIPHVDHTIPPDVSWPDFVYYMELKKRCLDDSV